MTKPGLNSDRIAGALCLGFGGLCAGYAAINYNFGRMAFLGAGAFPVFAAVLLAGIGLIMVIRSMRAGAAENAQVGTPNLEMLVRTTLAIAGFAITLPNFGAVPAVFALVAAMMLNRSAASVRHFVITATCLSALAVGLFGFLLNIRFEALKWPL